MEELYEKEIAIDLYGKESFTKTISSSVYNINNLNWTNVLSFLIWMRMFIFIRGYFLADYSGGIWNG